MQHHKLLNVLKELPKGAKILDIGCLNLRLIHLAKKIRNDDLFYYGVDYVSMKEIPEGFIFKEVNLDLESLPFEDDYFDFVVGLHVIEHLKQPLEFYKECMRICKPGGLLYLEAPSERALLLPGMPFEHDKFFSLSFYDDPTHQSRPWSPQAFFRLSKLFGCEPISTNYIFTWWHRLLLPFVLPLALLFKQGRLLQHIIWNAIGWSSYLLVRKPRNLKGIPSFHYYIPSR